jgi:hypothetical protein
LTSIQFEQDNDIHDTTTFGSTAHSFIGGLTNGKITIQGLWDKTATVGSKTVFQPKIGTSTPTAFVYGPEGNTTGNVKYTGTAVVESYTESTPVADLVTVNVVLQISGAVTAGVY